MVKKPQFVPPPPPAEYWAHHRVLSQGSALAGVCISVTASTTSPLHFSREAHLQGLLIVTRNNNVGSYLFPALAFGPIQESSV
jgi:hypothetical protein